MTHFQILVIKLVYAFVSGMQKVIIFVQELYCYLHYV